MLLVKVKLYHGGTALVFATIYFIYQKWKFFSIIIWWRGGIMPNYCNNHMVYNIPCNKRTVRAFQRKIPFSKSCSITE